MDYIAIKQLPRGVPSIKRGQNGNSLDVQGLRLRVFTAKGLGFSPGWGNQDPTSLAAWLERKQNKMGTHKMLSAAPGTEALRHSSFIIINPINIDIGFLPKIQRRGVILDWGWGAAITIFELQSSWQQCHCRTWLGQATLPSLQQSAISIATTSAQARGSCSQPGDSIATATRQDGKGRSR